MNVERKDPENFNVVSFHASSKSRSKVLKKLIFHSKKPFLPPTRKAKKKLKIHITMLKN